MPSKRKEIIICKHCGCESLKFSRNVRRGAKFCGKVCAATSRKKSKKCSTCGAYFYGSNRFYCGNACRGKAMTRWVGERSPSWKGGPKAMKRRAREKFPEKHKAYRKLGKAVKKGKVIRAKFCSRCDAFGRIEAHHPDYSKPLEVVWLCRRCHSAIHNAPKTT